jgi:hypothetical protein
MVVIDFSSQQVSQRKGKHSVLMKDGCSNQSG